MKTVISLLACLVCGVTTTAQVTISVQNALPAARSFEMVQVDAQKVKTRLGADTLIVTDADGKEIPSQLTWDGKLIFQASVGAKGKSTYRAVAVWLTASMAMGQRWVTTFSTKAHPG